MRKIPKSNSFRAINRKPTRAELEARRLRDLQRLNDAWRALTREVRT